MSAHTPCSPVKPHLDSPHFIVSGLYCPRVALFEELSILHILNNRCVCSVSLTTDSANICTLLCMSVIEYSLQVLEPTVFQRGARIDHVRGPRAGAAAGDLYTNPKLYFDLHHVPHLDDISAIRRFFRDSVAHHRLGRVFVSFPAPRLRFGIVFLFTWYIFQRRLGRVCLLVCLIFHSTATKTRICLL